ncbi:hypothetical protein G6F60_015131 [Rhizopus arrhizus]|nr:hypothetical protein G6F60_015131 [Rhizopus arrhizus]
MGGVGRALNLLGGLSGRIGNRRQSVLNNDNELAIDVHQALLLRLVRCGHPGNLYVGAGQAHRLPNGKASATDEQQQRPSLYVADSPGMLAVEAIDRLTNSGWH